MRRLLLRTPDPDARTLPLVEAAARLGYHINGHVAEVAWERYSDSMAAGWMSVPESDEDTLAILLAYCDVVED